MSQSHSEDDVLFEQYCVLCAVSLLQISISIKTPMSRRHDHTEYLAKFHLKL